MLQKVELTTLTTFAPCIHVEEKYIVGLLYCLEIALMWVLLLLVSSGWQNILNGNHQRVNGEKEFFCLNSVMN